ncbi:MAG: hypothetical protein ACRAVC_18950 [Trichormus sp.]
MAKNGKNNNSIYLPQNWKTPLFKLNQVIRYQKPDIDDELCNLTGSITGFMYLNSNWVYLVHLTPESLILREQIGISISELTSNSDMLLDYDYITESEIISAIVVV